MRLKPRGDQQDPGKCRSTIMRNFAQIMFTTLAAVAISGTLFTSVLA